MDRRRPCLTRSVSKRGVHIVTRSSPVPPFSRPIFLQSVRSLKTAPSPFPTLATVSIGSSKFPSLRRGRNSTHMRQVVTPDVEDAGVQKVAHNNNFKRKLLDCKDL